MTTTVYTIGYSGRKPEELKQIAKDLNATLLDIRFSPRSRLPQWAGSNVKSLVDGDYQHIKALGNANYKGDGPVEIVDYAAGRAAIRANQRPVILMCACGDPTHCHRTVVANMLREEGFTVTELNAAKPPAAPKQPPKPKAAQLHFF